MKAVKELKGLYDAWRHIDNLYHGEKSNWGEIYDKLWCIEDKLRRLKFRNDENRLFYDYIRRKMVDDIEREEIRVIKKTYQNGGI